MGTDLPWSIMASHVAHRPSRRRRRTASLSALLVLLALVLPASGAATGPGANGLLIFSDFGDVATVPVGGTPTNITQAGEDEYFEQPAVSFDGSRLAFLADDDRSPGSGAKKTVTSNLQGGARVDLRDTKASAQFLPDGRLLGTVQGQDGVQQLYAVQPDGTGPVQLTSGGGRTKQDAVASADGVVYYIDYSYNSSNPFVYRLLALDLETLTTTQVLSYSSQSTMSLQLRDVSPDGARLLLHRFSGGTSTLLTREIDGGDEVELRSGVTQGVFSPDGVSVGYVPAARTSMRAIGLDGTGDRLLYALDPADVAGGVEIRRFVWQPRADKSLEVNVRSDEPDHDLDDGVCDADPAVAGRQCSLRAAIQESARPLGTPEDPARITFDLPAPAAAPILVGDPLPEVAGTVRIDGRSQAGGQVELRGGAGDGLVLTGPESRVSGMVITGFERHGVALEGGAAQISGNVIGGRPDGDCPAPCELGNGGDGVRIRSSENVVGPPGVPQLVTAPLTRPDAAGTANVVGWNQGAGIAVESGTGNHVAANDLPGNLGQAIDLGADGVSANDPGDADDGPGGLLNAPVLTIDDRDSATVSGAIQAKPNTDYLVEVYADAGACDGDLSRGGGRYASGEPFGGLSPVDGSILDPVRTNSRGEARFTRTWVALEEPGSLRVALVDGELNASELSNCVEDTDEDGINDAWERDGLDADRDGEPEVPLDELGAEVGRKNVFLEVDAVRGHELSDQALGRIRGAYRRAPVSNPDGSTGIELRIDNGPGSPLGDGSTWGSRSRAEVLARTGASDALNFPAGGTGGIDFSQLNRLAAEHLDFARGLAFKYAYVTGTLSVPGLKPTGLSIVGVDGAGGVAPGRLMAIGLGDSCADKTVPCAGSDDLQAGNVMHELGHLHALGHGGEDSLNLKPNHFSVMNYLFIGGVLAGVQQKRLLLDYSRVGAAAATAGPDGWLPSLDETDLDETAGLRGGSLTAPYRSAYACLPPGAPKIVVRPIDSVTAPVDWDCDGDASETGLSTNVNFDTVKLPGGADQPILSTFSTATEWDRLDFSGHGAPDPDGGAPGPSFEEIQRNLRGLWDDTQPPTVSLEPGAQEGASREVVVRAADEQQLDSLRIVVDGKAVTIAAPEVAEGVKAAAQTHRVTVTGAGPHRVQAFATDRAQNLSPLADVEVAVAGPPAPPAPPPTGGGTPPPAAAPVPLPGPTGTPAPLPPVPPAAGAARFPAKLVVERAGVRRGRLDALVRITGRATGRLALSYESSGTRTRFTAPIRRGTVRISRRLPRRAARKSTGILTLSYAGNDRVRPDEVRLRAASGKARLRRTQAAIDARGRLRVAGTISKRARGVVRVRLGYPERDGTVRFLTLNAGIRDGRWAVSKALPARAASVGGQLSIQYTGYEPRRIRGEQDAKQVRP